MADRNVTPEMEHEDLAGWVLGALDPGESERFQAHLGSCRECQQAAADLAPTARMLEFVASARPQDVEPPADLQARTLARVRKASRKSAWQRRNAKLTAAAAAAVIAAGTVAAVTLGPSGTAAAFTIPLQPQHGGTSPSGQAQAHHTASGWSIQMTVKGLKPLPSGQFYECWYAGPGSRPGHLDLITAGTFTVGSSGSATVQMWSAADPRDFTVMEITAEGAGDGHQHGQVILSGTARQ